MTSGQSKKKLNSKIARNEEILQGLRKSNAIIEEQKTSSALVKIMYHREGEMASEIIIDPAWFHSPELRSDLHHCIKIAKDGFIELLEKDLQLMKEGPGK